MNETFTSLFNSGIGAVTKALLILLLAFITAAIVKSLTVKLFTKTKLNALLGQTDDGTGRKEKTITFIGKLIHLLVFLLFVPGIFESLGMREVSSPILNLLNTMWGYLPNILASIIVLWVGFFIAKLAREIVTPIFSRLNVNILQSKAGIQPANTVNLSDTLAYIVYVLILIPVVVAALQVLNIQAVSTPAIQMLNTIFEFIPNILASLVIVIIGCMVARFSGNIVEHLIASAGFDAKLAERLDTKGSVFILSRTIGKTIQFVMVVFFIVESFGVLHLSVLTGIGNAVIGYLPYVLASALILLACYICDGLAGKALHKTNHAILALISRAAIYGIGIFMILSELGIAKELVDTAFLIIIAALAAAFAISFGIGGRDFAAKVLKKLSEICGLEQKEK